MNLPALCLILTCLNSAGALWSDGAVEGKAGFIGVTVRVQETRGGPQIHVNGKPVPPRFFFGSMNSGTITAKSDWTSHVFEFIPGEVNGTGTLHFRFAHEPGEVWLADLRIQDAKTGEDVLPPGSFATAERFAKQWNQWPVGAANTVGTVTMAEGAGRIVLQRPPDGKWPDFHLHSHATLRFAAGRTYRCTFRAKATPEKELRVALYSVSGGSWNYIGGPSGSFLSQVGLARRRPPRFLLRAQLLDAARNTH